jgi:HEAT repeat protein
MRRVVLTAVLAAAVAGCGPATPTLSGGKPATHWVEVLKDPNEKERKKAAFELGNVGPTDAAAYPALKEALKDAAPAVRSEAIKALVKFGARAKDALPDLKEMEQNDPDAGVRGDAGQLVRKLEGGASLQ